MISRRVDLSHGILTVHAGSVGCTLEVVRIGSRSPSERALPLRDRRELDEVITALMDVRERLIEEPHAFKERGLGHA